MPTPRGPRDPKTKPTAEGPSEFAPGMFVGGWKEALRFEGSRFCVLDEAPEGLPPATHVPIYNERRDRVDPRSLDRLAAAMQEAHVSGQPVLVFCGHGVRRSPLGAAWYLHRTEGIPLGEAYDRIAAVRPQIERANAWIGNAEELEDA